VTSAEQPIETGFCDKVELSKSVPCSCFRRTTNNTVPKKFFVEFVFRVIIMIGNGLGWMLVANPADWLGGVGSLL